MKLNTIYTADCLEKFSVMDDVSVDYVFTSPPYNRKRNDKYTLYDDTLVDYKSFLTEVIEQSMRVSREHVFFNIQKNYYNKVDVFEIIGKFAENIVDIIIWNKTNPMPASGMNITNAYEFVIVFHKTGKALKANNTYTKNVVTTNVYSSNPYRSQHRAVMHPELARKIFAKFMIEGKTVFDPFMGVGTTAVVAKEFSMDYIGVELVQDYVDIANERLLQESSKFV